MSLDEKIGPIARRLGPIGRAYHRIDDEVHRYYEKIVQKAESESKGAISRQRLSYAAWASAIILGFTTPSLPDDAHDAIFNTLYLPFVPTMFANAAVQGTTSMGRSHDGMRESGDQKIVSDPFIYRVWRIARGPRLAMLATGCTALIGGGVHFLNGFRENDPIAMQIGQYAAHVGVRLLAHASSIYLIDKKPSLLDKAPAWKQALDSVKEYLAPVPALAPMPEANNGRVHT